MDGTPQPQIALDNNVQTASDTALSEDTHVKTNDAGTAPTRTLERLSKGEHAIVVGVNASSAFGSLDALVTRRLWELGFLSGAQISVVGFGLLNRDPIAVKIGGTKFALRRAEAQKILVTSVKPPSEPVQ